MEQGLGLRMAAEELGLSPAYLSRIEQDKEPPPRPEMIERMATLLGGGDALFMLAEVAEPHITEFLAKNPSARGFLRSAISSGWSDVDFKRLGSQVERSMSRMANPTKSKLSARRDKSMQSASSWPTIWNKFLGNLANERRCPRHPEFPHVKSMVQGVINDVMKIDITGILVRSHRTNNADFIPQGRFKAWWEHLVQHGSASLVPGGVNNPDPWRSRIVGAIMSTALPEEIEAENSNTIVLKGAE